VRENVAAELDATPSRSDIGGTGGSSAAPERTLLVFKLGDHTAAFPIEDVERITPMAQLLRPPGLPSMLEGILNYSGAAVPVLRLDRLLELSAPNPGLYSVIILLKGACDGGIGILADCISRILSVPESAVVRVGPKDSFNACAEALVVFEDVRIHVLSPPRILVEKEQQVLAEFRRIAQQRLQEWEPARP
jgi:purine-binding chemotaxis protein CheW